MQQPKRYSIVGVGGRSGMWRDAAAFEFSSTSTLVGICDSNAGRVRRAQEELSENENLDVPGYAAEDFDKMVEETKPNVIIVTTPDHLHDYYICRSLELDCDVVTEKPMTTDEDKCQRILDAKQRTGRNITVSFNYRFAPPRTQVKDLLMSGVIGDVHSVDFHWNLDVHHGADYFRRWHRRKENSGGLLVHKATHHFDLVNWWLSSVPTKVYATGHRHFYTPATAERYGLKSRTDRCHTCPEAPNCPFVMDLEGNEKLKKLYLDNEGYDGYFRDGCVFSPDIDIEDSMYVTADYRNGVKLSYSLNAFLPWEGYMVAFNGSKGRLEHQCQESVYINADGSVPGALEEKGTWLHIYPHWQPAYGVDLWRGQGGHGGADPIMLRYIFDPDNQPADKYMRTADERAGAWSVLTGVAANHAIENGRPFEIDELVDGLSMPEYPPMPGAEEPLPTRK